MAEPPSCVLSWCPEKRDKGKRPGSDSAKRFDAYKGATTVVEFLNLGGSKEDLKNDIRQSFLTCDGDWEEEIGVLQYERRAQRADRREELDQNAGNVYDRTAVLRPSVSKSYIEACSILEDDGTLNNQIYTGVNPDAF